MLKAKSWPFDEARTLLSRLKKLEAQGVEKEEVIFETGYGPSGLPHLGTFAEVLRTSMVMRSFKEMTGRPARLIVFSDDMDALRKVPDNIPNLENIALHLEKPLSSIPDPYGTHESFAHHNNARLCSFLDRYQFDYEFKSATSTYKSGAFDDTLREVLNHVEPIMAKILPTLSKERQASYSPFLPIDRDTGKVLQIPIAEIKLDSDSIVFRKEDGSFYETQVTGGHCKLQWKADWAMRWKALAVDYEMAGKDLIESVHLSGAINRMIGGMPPAGFSYELFLDENGEKISKSRGNGLSMDEWLTYGGEESLAYFLFQKPRTAKRLGFESIPKTMDEYNRMYEAYPTLDSEKQYDSPIYHIHHDGCTRKAVPVSYQLLLNLASVLGNPDKAMLWKFINKYDATVTPETHSYLDKMVGYALNYCKDHILPHKLHRDANPKERMALEDLSDRLQKFKPTAEPLAEALQTIVFDVGKAHEFTTLKDWFQSCYQILFGQNQGPKLGTFIALYGIKETQALIQSALDTSIKLEQGKIEK